MAKYHCGLCGRPLKPKDVQAGRVTYSRWTGERYCPVRDWEKCRSTRARQKKREEAVA